MAAIPVRIEVDASFAARMKRAVAAMDALTARPAPRHRLDRPTPGVGGPQRWEGDDS